MRWEAEKAASTTSCNGTPLTLATTSATCNPCVGSNETTPHNLKHRECQLKAAANSTCSPLTLPMAKDALSLTDMYPSAVGIPQNTAQSQPHAKPPFHTNLKAHTSRISPTCVIWQGSQRPCTSSPAAYRSFFLAGKWVSTKGYDAWDRLISHQGASSVHKVGGAVGGGGVGEQGRGGARHAARTSRCTGVVCQHARTAVCKYFRNASCISGFAGRNTCNYSAAEKTQQQHHVHEHARDQPNMGRPTQARTCLQHDAIKRDGSNRGQVFLRLQGAAVQPCQPSQAVRPCWVGRRSTIDAKSATPA
jgi:hypothetical protein